MECDTLLRIRDVAAVAGIAQSTVHKSIKSKGLKTITLGNKKYLPPSSVRKILEDRGFQYSSCSKPLIISVNGMKGGIGKTSIATAISEGGSRLGFRTLCADLDMQGNLSNSFKVRKHGVKVLIDLISEKDVRPADIIRKVHEYLDIIPSNLSNSHLENALTQKAINYPTYFESLFNELYPNYDLIVLDCPPSINKATTCATFFADFNLIPVNADYDSFDGVNQSVSEIKRLEDAFRKPGTINYGILFNKYDAREKLSMEIMGLLGNQDILKNYVMPLVIRTDTAFKNTKAAGGHIFDLTKSNAKEDCLSLILELTGLRKFFSKDNTPEMNDELETV